ncbi:MAG: CDP-glucose 4,6-dehydratase [Actinomycetota bacterium]|nr:CDP-glucose 4,6-dehydratase [Actinomycetota bacterium]
MTAYWRGRRVLVTGHTGFKGAWLVSWLEMLGAEVVGLSLPARTDPCLWGLIEGGSRLQEIIGDIRDRPAVERAMSFEPEVVFHLAAQALVRRGFREPAETFDVNLRGTVNVLDVALHTSSVRAVLVVTSDKVYDDRAGNRPYEESAPIGGADPYSASKAGCELVTRAYRASYFGPRAIGLGTARAGNVIGGGDWSDERLIPDLVRSGRSGEALALRYPDATRPWQHVLDPLYGYLLFAEHLVRTPSDLAPASLNFGPQTAGAVPVRALVERWESYFGESPGWRLDEGPHPPEAAALELSSTLAATVLGWKAALLFDDALRWTAEWYADFQRGKAGADLVRTQVARYQALVS